MAVEASFSTASGIMVILLPCVAIIVVASVVVMTVVVTPTAVPGVLVVMMFLEVSTGDMRGGVLITASTVMADLSIGAFIGATRGARTNDDVDAVLGVNANLFPGVICAVEEFRRWAAFDR